MLLRISVAALFVVGCAGAQSVVESAECVACDLDVDHTALMPRSTAPKGDEFLPHTVGATPRNVEAGSIPARPTYRGHKIDLNLKEADVHDVFRLLAHTGNTNIVVADDVRGRVTMSLHRVPWDQALATIAAVSRLSIVHRDGVYLITPRR